MHKLHRGAAPACLADFQHGQHNWSDVTPAQKATLWTELEAMQGQRCAYCESEFRTAKRHIEHFCQKGRDPKGTFVWSNLFGSCNREDSCGKHKDESAVYPPAVLIKPDVDDPEHFLVFAADGSISPRKNRSTSEQHRATETIRLFNLNGVLRQIRFREVAGYLQTAEYFAEVAAEHSEAEWIPLLQQEISDTAHLPFATAIKHVLTRQSSHP